MFASIARNVGRSGARMMSTSAASAAKNQRAVMGASAVAAGIAAGVAGYKSECLKIEIDDATASKLLSALSGAPKVCGPRYNELMTSPPEAKLKACVVEFNVPGAKNGGSDKGPNGHRIDSIPIANGIIKAGGACEILKYFDTKHAEFTKAIEKYDALIVRINPGQLSQGTLPGTQQRFDALMNAYIAKGGIVWSSPDVQTKMGAKDALCKIANMNCGDRKSVV